MQENWIECWQTRTVDIGIRFAFYLCPVLDWSNGSLPSVEYYAGFKSPNFECDERLEPDNIELKIEIGPSLILVYGTMLKRLWYIKEAYFSWDQYFTEMMKNLDQLFQQQQQQQQQRDASVSSSASGENKLGASELSHHASKKTSNVSRQYVDMPVQLVACCNYWDPRTFRPLSVQLSLAIHNLNGHLVLDVSEGVGNVPFPIAFSDRLALELDKSYRETRLQLYVDPINLFVEDQVMRSYDRNLFQGHLCLSSVQLRGHAMFSDESRLKTDTLEYAWLLEILLGELTGSLTPVHAKQIVHGVESLVLLLIENDYQLEPVFVDRSDPGLPFKYEVVRFSLDLIDLYLVECATALNFNLRPIRMSTCNSHTNDYAKGLSAGVGEFSLRMFINEASRSTAAATPSSSDENHHHHHESGGARRRGELKKTSTLANHGESRLDSISNLSSSSSSVSLSSIDSSSLSSLSTTSSVSSSAFRSSPNMSSSVGQNTIVMNSHHSPASNRLLLKSATLNRRHHRLNRSIRSGGDNHSHRHQHQHRVPDSNEFNYWFECSSLSSGVISIDLALDAGQPDEQLKFLRLHDAKTKRLYFLWNTNQASETAGVRSRRVCGCVGGCYYYSVFPDKASTRAAGFDFFDLAKSISRTSVDFGQSLFVPGKHVLQSQAMMRNKLASFFVYFVSKLFSIY